MDFALLQLWFDCRMDVDVNGLPLPVIVLVGLLVGSANFVKLPFAKCAKVDVVLGMIADMDNAHIFDAATSLVRRSFHVGFAEHAA
jgi:hypothetical protein